MRHMEDPGADFVRTIDDDKLDAMVEAVYLAACADGVFSDVERQHFAESLALLTGGRVDDDRVESVRQRVAANVASQGRSSCIESIARRLDSDILRHVAFVLALDMVAADGRVLPSERRFLQELAVGLGISTDEAGEIMADIPTLLDPHPAD
jgi:tellurite resistance protein